MEEHRLFGGDPDVDVAFQYLTFFFEDDQELENIRQSYRTGELLTGELKRILIDLVAEIVERHKVSRAEVSDAIVDEFMYPRPLEF